jgi:hypothetical protein
MELKAESRAESGFPQGTLLPIIRSPGPDEALCSQYHWYIAAGKRSGDLGHLYAEFLGMGRPESQSRKWLNLYTQTRDSWHVSWTYKSSSEIMKAGQSAISTPPNPIFAACVWGFNLLQPIQSKFVATPPIIRRGKICCISA